MALRWTVLCSLSVIGTRALGLDWWVHESCDEPLSTVSVDVMAHEAVETVQDYVSGLEDGDPKLLVAFQQLYNFDYQAPGQENEEHLETFKSKHRGYRMLAAAVADLLQL